MRVLFWVIHWGQIYSPILVGGEKKIYFKALDMYFKAIYEDLVLCQLPLGWGFVHITSFKPHDSLRGNVIRSILHVELLRERGQACPFELLSRTGYTHLHGRPLSSCCIPPSLSTLKSHNYLLPASPDAQTINCPFLATRICSCHLLVTARSPPLQGRRQNSSWGTASPAWRDCSSVSPPHLYLLSPLLAPL